MSGGLKIEAARAWALAHPQEGPVSISEAVGCSVALASRARARLPLGRPVGPLTSAVRMWWLGNPAARTRDAARAAGVSGETARRARAALVEEGLLPERGVPVAAGPIRDRLPVDIAVASLLAAGFTPVQVHQRGLGPNPGTIARWMRRFVWRVRDEVPGTVRRAAGLSLMNTYCQPHSSADSEWYADALDVWRAYRETTQ